MRSSTYPNEAPEPPTIAQGTQAQLSPELSIVIPAKDEELYLESTLLHWCAVRRDHGLDFTIVVVDGGSCDNTAQAGRLADLFILDSRLAEESIAHGRNIGARSSKSKFIFHTDADVVVPDMLGLLTEADLQFTDPRVVAVTTRILPHPSEARRLDRIAHFVMNASIRAALPAGAFLARGECQIVRRTAFEEVGGYNGRIALGEDCDLFRRLHKVGRIRYLRQSCVYHSVRRFKRWGYLRVLAVFAREVLWLVVLRRPRLQEWKPVR